MKITAANKPIWQNLFQAAIDFRDLAPWQWLYDSEIFGVQDPETGEMGWCCIMGAGGEVFALGVYLGDEGFQTYLNLCSLSERDVQPADYLATGLEQKLLKAEFVDRDEIEKGDLEAFKSLGLKFRGKRQWALIRDHQPGYYPWYLSDKQAVFLTHCLRQAIDVALRSRENEDLLQPDENSVLVRLPKKKGTALEWSDLYLPEPEWDEPPLRNIDPFLLNRAQKELPSRERAFCFSLDYIPGVFGPEKGENRPFFGKLAIWMDYGSGYILGTEVFSPETFASSFDQYFFNILHQAKFIPAQLIVNSQLAYDALEPISDALGVSLIFEPSLEVFQEVKESMGMFLGGMGFPGSPPA